MTFEIKLILEIHVVVNNWYFEDDIIEVLGFIPTFIIPCPLSSQGLISRETNKVFSLALM